uniref:Cytochrome P450 monooxygenase sdnT n=1 Tax=Sordaria araneosa TaxID=573841 RepID=SDNT_SORAA|nr:RecName: Full=Cytochrome P450 monooxygenase sdnT; AltName: Full=Sordarin/hypoxysordarin biosynthesis cluster protein C [Sordaria araneosa]BAV32164.1 cytochrome P450 monooxygenase [Sordaria araneosa]
MELLSLGSRQRPSLHEIGLSIISLTTCFVCAFAVSFVALAIYRAHLHPLAAIPGPKLAALSSAWQAYHARNGRMLVLGKTLHAVYGPIVRVGPNEVWLNSPDAFRSIYGAGNGYEKSDFYLSTVLNKPAIDWGLNLHFPDTLDLLSEFDTRRYRLQRRLVGPVYQANNIKKFQNAVDDVIERAVAQLRTLDGAEVDLKEWMHIIVVECLGAVVLSWSPGYIAAETDGGTGTQSYLGWKRKSVFGLFPLVTTATFFSKGLGRLFSNLWGVTFPTPKNFKPFFTPVYHKSSKRINVALRQNAGSNTRPKPPKRKQDTQPNDLLTDLIQLHKAKAEFTEQYLRRMAITNFGAGHETMCSALTSIMAMVGSHPAVQGRIIDELGSHGYLPSTCTSKDQKPIAGQTHIDYDAAASLTYCLAAIKEAQRLYPVIGMSLSRKVPASGLSVHDVYIPPGTTVGCSPVSLHRNTTIFGDDASCFNPERWLQDNVEARRAMERYNLTWGGGGRTCPGRHLAEMVVWKVVPALLREFEVVVTKMPNDVEVEYYFMAMLTGVRARFIPRR